MRRLIAILALTLVAIGCKKESKEQETDDEPKQKKTKEKTKKESTAADKPLGERAVKLDNKRSEGAYDEVFDDYYTDETAFADAYLESEEKGADQMRDTYEKNREVFDTPTVAPRRVLVGDGTTITEGVFKGKHTGEVWETEPTEEPVGVPYVQIREWRDGKVKRTTTYFNTSALMRQVGAAPPRGDEPPAVPEVPEDPEVVDEQGADEQVDALTTFVDAVQSNALAQLPELVTDDWKLIRFDDERSDMDMKKTKKFFEKQHEVFDDMKLEITNSWSVGPYAVASVKGTATHTGKIGEWEGTGKEVTTHTLLIGEFDGGRMKTTTMYHDQTEVLTQIAGNPKKALMGPDSQK